jgi:hypothetical protein
MEDFPRSVRGALSALTHKKTHAFKMDRVVVQIVTCSTKPVEPVVPQYAAKVVETLWPFRNCRNHSFTAHIYLCDVPKYLPVEGVLTPDHVNTGFSYPCRSLVVYRKQEWFKVFIHECFHYLALDKGIDEKNRLNMFTLSFDVSLRETFCEMWARILQAFFLGGIRKERTHAVRNMVRVLRHGGLVYSDLWGAKGEKYREQTNVFSYVILTAILFHDYDAFVHAFPNFHGNTMVMLSLIRENYRSPSFLRRVRVEEAKTSDTGPFRMSAVEIKV